MSRLDYPLTFVDIALKKHEEKQKEGVEAKLEAKGAAEEIESPKELDLRAELSEFQKKQEIEQRKEWIRLETDGSINLLSDMENEYREENVYDEVYDVRQQLIKRELEDFVLVKVDEIDSIEAVSDLERISEEIGEKIVALYDEYDRKVSDQKEFRKNKEKERSDQLLNQKIDIPLFPQPMKELVRKRFLIRNLEEASIVADALNQIVLLIMKGSNNNEEKQAKMWQTFTEIVKEGGWDYLKRMAEQYRQDNERMLISINVCPRCESKLTRKRVEDKVIISCPSCRKAWEIIEN